LDQITHIGVNLSSYALTLFSREFFSRNIPFYVITLPERQTDTETDGRTEDILWHNHTIA